MDLQKQKLFALELNNFFGYLVYHSVAVQPHV